MEGRENLAGVAQCGRIRGVRLCYLSVKEGEEELGVMNYELGVGSWVLQDGLIALAIKASYKLARPVGAGVAGAGHLGQWGCYPTKMRYI